MSRDPMSSRPTCLLLPAVAQRASSANGLPGQSTKLCYGKITRWREDRQPGTQRIKKRHFISTKRHFGSRESVPKVEPQITFLLHIFRASGFCWGISTKPLLPGIARKVIQRICGYGVKQERERTERDCFLPPQLNLDILVSGS